MRGEHLAHLADLSLVATALFFDCELVLRSQLLGPALKLKAMDRKRLTSGSLRRFASSHGLLRPTAGLLPATLPSKRRLRGIDFTVAGLDN